MTSQSPNAKASPSSESLPEGASDTVRVVHVGDYDECLCIGAHVKNTAEIGTFKIISYDYKEGIFRMRFKLIENK